MRLQEACDLLQQNHVDTSLSLLNLSGQGIGSAGVTKLVDCCGCCSNTSSQEEAAQDKDHHHHDPSLPLVVLWLENNEIYSRGAISLNKLIQYSKHLKYIYMAHNHIGNAGIDCIAPIIFQQLQICNLADNDINGVIGATPIADCLVSSKEDDYDSPLKTLILESNKLGNDGATKIAESLKHNTTLIELELRYNSIGIEGLTSIRNALREEDGNKTIQSILLEEEEDINGHMDRPRGTTGTPTTHDYHHHNRPTKYLKVGGWRRARRTRNQMLHQTNQQQQTNSVDYCTCERCKLRFEIDYYLALNRAGRHSFGNMNIHPGLWPRILSRVSYGYEEQQQDNIIVDDTQTSVVADTTTTANVDGYYDRSILFAMLRTRPDMLLKQQKQR